MYAAVLAPAQVDCCSWRRNNGHLAVNYSGGTKVSWAQEVLPGGSILCATVL